MMLRSQNPDCNGRMGYVKKYHDRIYFNITYNHTFEDHDVEKAFSSLLVLSDDGLVERVT